MNFEKIKMIPKIIIEEKIREIAGRAWYPIEVPESMTKLSGLHYLEENIIGIIIGKETSFSMF